jgi:hypothetical protein
VQGDDIDTNDTATSVESSAPATETVSSTPSTDASSSTPSETSGEQSKETLLDAVLKVTDVTPEEGIEGLSKGEGAPSSQEPDSEVKAEDEQQEGEEVADAEETSKEIPVQTRKKINKLLRERRELRDEVAAMRPAAEIGQQLHNFQQSNNLSTDGIIDALDLLVMVNKGDYAGFYERIAPVIRHTQEVLGIVLPPDLDQMVAQQQMTPEAARKFANTRFERTNYEVQARQLQAREEFAVSTQVRDNVQRSVTAYEQRLAANDPDYKAKQESVRRAAQAILFERGGRINSVDEALAITHQAYNEVSAQYRRIQQPVRATAPQPGRSNPQTPSARPQPKTLMDAVKNALNRG